MAINPLYLLNRRRTAYVIKPDVCWCDRGVVVGGGPPGGAKITAVIKSVQKLNSSSQAEGQKDTRCKLHLPDEIG